MSYRSRFYSLLLSLLSLLCFIVLTISVSCKRNKNLPKCISTASTVSTTGQSSPYSIYGGFIKFTHQSLPTEHQADGYAIAANNQFSYSYCQALFYLNGDSLSPERRIIDGIEQSFDTVDGKIFSSRSCLVNGQNAIEIHGLLYVDASDEVNEQHHRSQSGYVPVRFSGQAFGDYYHARDQFISNRGLEMIKVVDDYLFNKSYSDQYKLSQEDSTQYGPATTSEWSLGVCETQKNLLDQTYKTIKSALQAKSFQSGCVFINDLVAIEEKVLFTRGAIERVVSTKLNWNLPLYLSINSLDQTFEAVSAANEITLWESLLTEDPSSLSGDNISQSSAITNYLQKQITWWDLVQTNLHNSSESVKFYLSSITQLGNFNISNFFGDYSLDDIRFVAVPNGYENITRPSIEFNPYGMNIIDNTPLSDSVYLGSLAILGQIPIGIFANWNNELLNPVKPNRILVYDNPTNGSVSPLHLSDPTGSPFNIINSLDPIAGNTRETPLGFRSLQDDYQPVANKPEC